MAELESDSQPECAQLRRAIRHQLRRFDPNLRVVAETFLAESTPIDLLAVGAEGEMISIRIGQDENDAVWLTRSLADLTWLRPRLGDFLKLAAGLGIEPSAEPRAMLLCPQFSPETRAAVENFPSRSIDLLTYHCFRQQGQLAVLLEPSAAPRVRMTGPVLTGSDPRQPTEAENHSLLAGAPSPSGFRTGLTDRDLRTSAASQSEEFHQSEENKASA